MTFSFPSSDGSEAFLGTVHTCPDILESTTFFSGFKNFHVHTHPYANRICLFTRIRMHSSTQDSSGNMGNRACVVKRAKFVSCSAFVATISTPVRHAQKSSEVEIAVGKELGSILLRHQIKNKYPDLASIRFRIHSVFKNFHSGERIQKYPDTCGRGLNDRARILYISWCFPPNVMGRTFTNVI